MSTSFHKKRIKLPKTLGEYLKSRRESRGISLALVERDLRIGRDYLESLERGEFDNLPADVYARGILKNYAEFLGINYEKTILPRYLRERGIHTSVYGEKKKHVDITKKMLKAPSIILTPKTLVILGVVLFVLGLGFYLWYQFSAFASAPELTVSSPSEGARFSTNIINITGKTNPGIDLLINGQEIDLAEDGSFKTRLTLQEGVNSVEFLAKNKVGKQTVIQRNVMVTLPKVATKSKTNKSFNVEVIVTIQNGATWLSVEEDDNPAYDGTMLPGSALTFRGKNSVTITSGKGMNTLIKVNGKDWGVLENTAGAVRDLEITKEMAEKGR